MRTFFTIPNFIRRSALVFMAVLSLLLISATPALALDIKNYFYYEYSAQFSKMQVNENESFTATITGSANCTKDLPMAAKEGNITGRIIAQNKSSGAKVTLNTGYSLSIPDVPDRSGQSIQITSPAIPLQFPAGSAMGQYSIIGEVTEVKVKAIVWFTLYSTTKTDNLIDFPAQPLGEVTFGTPPATTPPAGGGSSGGGGGGGFSNTVPVASQTSDVSRVVSDTGTFTVAFVAKSSDNTIVLFFAEGTRALNDDSSPVWRVTMGGAQSPHPVAANSRAIGATYSLGPSGATFDPPIKLTLAYDRYILADLPPGFDLKKLVIAVWDAAAEAWTILPSTVDAENHTISAPVEHFSDFTILAPTRPSEFVVSGLSLTPQEVVANEPVTISVTVTNTGDLSGSISLTLKLDDATVSTKDVSLAGGDKQQVTFTTSKSSPGSYRVSVNGLTGSLVVKPASTPSPTSTLTPVPGQTPGKTPAQTQPMPSTTPNPAPAPPAPKPFSWILLMGIVVILVIIGVAAQTVIFLKKR